MDKNKYSIIRMKMERTAEALRHNNMSCECTESREEALEIVKEYLKLGDSIAVGGSVTLDEVGVLELLRSGPYRFLDRYREGLSPEEKQQIFRQAFSADVFFSSANAITENGELYNVDGTCNRVAPMLFGPTSVIVIAGYNKIVRDLDEAKRRVCEIAAPANATRLHCGTPCTVIGKCADCDSADRICASTVIMARQRVKNRVKVILVGEEFGY